LVVREVIFFKNGKNNRIENKVPEVDRDQLC
jgi:hypothetical protein